MNLPKQAKVEGDDKALGKHGAEWREMSGMCEQGCQETKAVRKRKKTLAESLAFPLKKARKEGSVVLEQAELGE